MIWYNFKLDKEYPGSILIEHLQKNLYKLKDIVSFKNKVSLKFKKEKASCGAEKPSPVS